MSQLGKVKLVVILVVITRGCLNNHDAVAAVKHSRNDSELIGCHGLQYMLAFRTLALSIIHFRFSYVGVIDFDCLLVYTFVPFDKNIVWHLFTAFNIRRYFKTSPHSHIKSAWCFFFVPNGRRFVTCLRRPHFSWDFTCGSRILFVLSAVWETPFVGLGILQDAD